MSDTQPLTSSEELSSRIDSLKSLHEKYVAQVQQLEKNREALVASVFKIEGALEALADFKGSIDISTQPEALPKESEIPPTPEELVN